LTTPYYRELIHRRLGSDLAEQVTSDEAFTAVARAFRNAEAEGWQPERLLAVAIRRGDLTTAESPAQVLAWRLKTIAGDRPAPAHLDAPTAEDAARYAPLVASLTGLPAHRIDPEAANAEPAVLHVSPAAAQAPDAHPHVAAYTLNSYANDAATALNTTVDTITTHPRWPHLAGAMAAAQRAGRDTATLLTAASATANGTTDPITILTATVRARLAADGIPEAHQNVPAALRHHALAAEVLGDELAPRAQHERTWPALTAALRRAESAGHEPAALLRRAAESRPLTGADSITQVLAWRINRHLATATSAALAQPGDCAETELWLTLAWTLKAIENTGTTAETALAKVAGRTGLPELLQHAQQQALTHARAASGRADLPSWISGVPHSTAANPVHHQYLTDSAELIAARVSALADRATETRPDWARTLGKEPQDPVLHAQWQRHLAVVATYRDQYKVTDDNAAQPAGPYIEKGRAGHDAYWQATAAAIAARRIATTPMPGTGADRQARHQLAADVYRALPEADQAETLHTIATRTGATWLTDLRHLDDAALTHYDIAEQVSTALAERHQLPAEAAHPRTEERPQPTLADRRRAGRQAERQAHRDQLQERTGQPSHTARPAPARREEPAEQRQTGAPEPRPNATQPLQPPSQVRQNPEGPRLR
jgi:hypothetical protein